MNLHIITGAIVNEPNFLNLFMKKLTRERVVAELHRARQNNASTVGIESQAFPLALGGHRTSQV
jgi:hypothetical protein